MNKTPSMLPIKQEPLIKKEVTSPTSPPSLHGLDQNLISNAHLLSNEDLVKLLTILQPSVENANNFGVSKPNKGLPINLAPIKLQTPLNNFSESSPSMTSPQSNSKFSPSTFPLQRDQAGILSHAMYEKMCNNVRVSIPPFNSNVKVSYQLNLACLIFCLII